MVAPKDRVESSELVEAGLALMRACGKPLVRLPSKGRAMLYALPDGGTVRMRTCNDHLLIIVGDRPTSDAKLNIQGTDWLLVVMPEIERTKGRVIGYLLPTAEVEAEARRTHQEWLDTGPDTGGDNKTWNLWFRSNGPAKANNYQLKWSKYRLAVSADLRTEEPVAPTKDIGGVKAEVEAARQRIAAAAGVPVEAIRITINFEG